MNTTEIMCPVPGVFYRSPSPEEDPFVAPGQTVSAKDVIGLVEVMKQFFPVEAGCDGELKEFLVENGEEVMAGQVLATCEAV